MTETLRGVLAYDPATGRILHALFGRARRSPRHDPLAAHLMDLVRSSGPAHVLDVAPDAMKPGVRYRVDPSGKALVPVGEGEPGFAAACGAARPPGL